MKAPGDLTGVSDDTPLRLAIAAKLAFPDGSMSERGLKREIERGRLACERIAGKVYTTFNYIKRMRDECRENHSGSESGSETEKDDRRYGSSSTDQRKSAQDALQRMSLALTGRSNNTSQSDISRTSGKASQRP